MDITINDLKELSNPIIIDVRSPYSYNMGHIDGAKNIEYINLLKDPSKYLDYNKTYYVYCEKGFTSKNVTNILNKQGYKVINITGGYSAYKRLKIY